MKPNRIIISGGGTGGHIYPAIAIADELKKRDPAVDILFVGAKDRMEMQKVPQAGYAIVGLWISGIQRKFSVKNFIFPFKLLSSLWKSFWILQNFKPKVVIGTGGFASGPLLKVASWKGIPILIQEQNSYAGITNKLLASSASKICVAYDRMEQFFPKNKLAKTGNPVRQDLFTIEEKRSEAIQKYGLHWSQKTILVLGGSLGARRINQLIEAHIDFFAEQKCQVIWQCGQLYYEVYKKHDLESHCSVYQYIDTMDLAYAAADIIISRAGASTVSELCIVGKPTLFIPSPNVAEDHQTKNAMAVANHQAALVIPELELDAKFKKSLRDLLDSEPLQKNLGTEMKKLALPLATASIVDEIEKLIQKS